MKWHQRFFWLLLLFLPTQLGYHFWSEWAMVLGRRVDYLAPTIYLTDVLLFATLLFWFKESISRIKNYELRIKGMTKKYIPSFILYSLFFILIGTNIYGADNQMVAIYEWGKVTEFVLLGWYIVRTKPKLSSLSFPLSVGVLYSSILAIAQFFLQHSVGGPLWWFGERTFTVDTPGIARIDWYGRELLRPYATSPHPNVLGGFLVAVLPLLLIRQIRPILLIRLMNETMSKIFQWTTIMLGMIALVLTFSRSAIVVGAIAIAIARIKKHELRIMGIVLLVFILMSYVLRPTSTEESVVVRQQLNAAAIKLWATSPLFGVGLGNFLVRLPEVLPTRTIYFLQPVHNIYLLLLAEIGIVGIGLIVLFVLWVLKYELRIMNYGKRKSKELFMLHTSLFIILLLGLVDHYPLTLQQGQLLLTILAALCIRGVTYEKN